MAGTGHPQSSPRGNVAHKQISVGSGGMYFTGYSTSNTLLDANTTGLRVRGQIQVNRLRYIQANSTAFIVTSEAAIPSTDQGVAFTMISNSTGVAMAVNSTGTTWKYLNTTSTQPT